ncbi:MAG TPA: prolyl oligopeptidase family serine peptidase [Fimbriimonadaceae bacterium]|nr:prolyl oligopeptidase family serine peptidase [Fimbriimonadaceae bacterium]
MRKQNLSPLYALVGSASLVSTALGGALLQEKLSYPATKKGEQIDTLHGTTVADPYRWLEDGDSEETKAWIKAQNEVTFAYLKSIPGRDRIAERVKDLWNFERFGIPTKEGTRYFYTRNDGLQNQAVLYVAESLNATPRVLLDPNKLSTDGTVALSGTAFSRDGKFLAYGTSSGGSDWQEWRVRDVDTGKDLADHIKFVKFSGASWTKDSSGFFYSRYDEPKGQALQEVNYFQKLYFHKLGTDQSQDQLVYERKDEKEWGFDGNVTDDGRYLILFVWQGTARENRVFYKDLQAKNAAVVELLPNPDAYFGFIGNVGPVFYFQTEKDAPRGRVVAIDTRKPQQKDWKTVIPESKDKLNGVNLLSGKLIANYLHDAHTQIKVFNLSGKQEREIALPGLGTAAGFGGRQDDSETFYSFAGYTTPQTIYRYDVKTGKSNVFRKPVVKFDPTRYESKQVFVSSKDGTKVPVFITARKGIKLDGNNPVLMTGYGGFSATETPYFSILNLVWLELGGVRANVVLRGGSEYGEEWHKAGMKDKKQNVFDDFIAAGEWLVKSGYTKPEKLAINGGSNGGLLVGAVLNQRPDLFGAAVPAVGVMDMLRFHKFTIGWAWTTEYGTPDKPEDFAYIYKYSPLHNIKPGTKYPAVLITTADHDDRVVPAHSFKYAAAMQEAQAGTAPVLIRIETRAGHGAGKPISKVIEEYSDVYAFLMKNLGMEIPAGFGKE